MTRILATIALLAVVVGCGALVALMDSAMSAAYNDALRRIETETPANETAQRVTAVCVGLNIGSCRATQDSASTSTPAGYPGANPWPLILLATAVICPVAFAAALRWFGQPGEV